MANLMSTALLVVALGLASAKQDGAPGDLACVTMTPQHPAPPQTGNSPFRILPSKTESSGEPIEITLAAPSQGPKFKGFFIQVRAVGGADPVGQFNPTADPNAKPVSCAGKDNVAMTHKDPSLKDQIKLQWTPPKGDGQYEIFVTFVQQIDTYWVKQTPDGDKITVSTGRAGPGSSSPGQQQPNSGGAPNNTGGSNSKNSSAQPPNPNPSEGGASSNIPLLSGISIAAATGLISFLRYTQFRLF